MIQGYFGDKGELYFEIDLIAADGSVVTVDALLDTGFTDWIAMDIQDVESLGWSSIRLLSSAVGITDTVSYPSRVITIGSRVEIVSS